MKNSRVFVRALLALICAVGLAACGGSNGTVKLGGTITGLSTAGLTLTDGYTSLTVSSGATSFQFPTAVTSNYSFAVSVLLQPTDYTCTVTDGSGIAGTTDINNISIACIQSAFTLGGVVNGLKAGNVVTLTNGSNTATVTGTGAAALPITFTSHVTAATTYGITFLAKPSNQTCTIVNPLGTMPNNDFAGTTTSTDPTTGAPVYTGLVVNCI